MQTFLPHPDFEKTAKVLDNKRLGNQVYREGKTLVNGGWPNHPASKMWRGYEYALCNYCLFLLDEMEIRNKWKREVVPRWRSYFTELQQTFQDTGLPFWFGDDRLHMSHRAALLHKDWEHYSVFGWTEQPAEPKDGKLPYYWPVK